MREKKVSHRLNAEIKHRQIRIIGDGIESKVCSVFEGIKIAESLGADLVEINSTNNPPICKIIKYDKFLYEEKRKQKEIERRNRELRVDIKEIRLTPNIDTHDIQFKSKHAANFLSQGDKVKIVMQFKGREIAYTEKAEKTILEFVQNLTDYGAAESLPKMEGKKMFIIVSPRKK
jgi:translation initiation factor IF-3